MQNIDVDKQIKELIEAFWQGELSALTLIRKVRELKPSRETIADIGWDEDKHNLAEAEVVAADSDFEGLGIDAGTRVFMIGRNLMGGILGVNVDGSEAQTFDAENLAPTGRKVTIRIEGEDEDEPEIEPLPEPHNTQPGEAYVVRYGNKVVNGIRNDDSVSLQWTLQRHDRASETYASHDEIELLARLVADRDF